VVLGLVVLGAALFSNILIFDDASPLAFIFGLAAAYAVTCAATFVLGDPEFSAVVGDFAGYLLGPPPPIRHTPARTRWHAET
jgi:hypothetical protein